MTIDERLEKLTGRHEALTQTVEMLTVDINSLQATVASLATASEAQRISSSFSLMWLRATSSALIASKAADFDLMLVTRDSRSASQQHGIVLDFHSRN